MGLVPNLIGGCPIGRRRVKPCRPKPGTVESARDPTPAGANTGFSVVPFVCGKPDLSKNLWAIPQRSPLRFFPQDREGGPGLAPADQGGKTAQERSCAFWTYLPNGGWTRPTRTTGSHWGPRVELQEKKPKDSNFFRVRGQPPGPTIVLVGYFSRGPHPGGKKGAQLRPFSGFALPLVFRTPTQRGGEPSPGPTTNSRPTGEGVLLRVCFGSGLGKLGELFSLR